MDLTFSEEELAFRDEIRHALLNEFPQDIRVKSDANIEISRDDQIRYQKWLAERGWFAINWPKEYGGTGWTAVQKYLFMQELANINAPTIVPYGVNMVGPVIYTFGNDAQKQRFLPDILESNVWWCQGYSEP